MHRCLAAFAILLGSFFIPLAAQAAHIDFFDDGGFVLFATDVGGPASGMQAGNPGNILGVEREVDLSFASGTGLISSALLVPPGPGPVAPNPAGVLLFSNSIASLGTMMLTYDGPGALGLGGLDFETAANFITVNFPSVQGAGLLTVAITDTLNNTGMLTGLVNSAGTYSFPFANVNYSGVDFSSIDSVVVTLETTVAASDFAIGSIVRDLQPGQNVIPEPATALLLVLGALGVVTSVRRRS
jgi:hypothetical protein